MNHDQECFKWSILAALHPGLRNPERVSNYTPYVNELNFDGIDFPVGLNQVKVFERQNDISVNIYGLDETFVEGRMRYEVVGPLYFTASRKTRHVNLLLITGNNENHYCWIKDMSRLVGNQISKHGHAKFLCDGCLVFFGSKAKLIKHQEHDCNHVRVNLPSAEKYRKDKWDNQVPENLLRFEDHDKKLKIPFTVFSDFEAILKPIGILENIKNLFQTFSIKTHQHIPYSFGYYIKCSFDNSISKYVTYRGPDAAKIFIEQLENDIKNIYHRYLKTPNPILMTSEDEINFSNATNCHICEKPFQSNDLRCRDHDHLGYTNNSKTSNYRGASHVNCNINFKIPKFIPIFFHNMSGYDSHLFIKDLAEHGSKIDVVAQNKERYITFSKHILVDQIKNNKDKTENVFMKLRFLDSFRFMAKSLDKLAQNLENNQCIEIKKHFPDSRQFRLLRQKGIFPYSYVSDFSKLDDTNLPPIAAFYDTLRKEDIAEEDYKRACDVWNVFECRNLGEYSDVYLKSDVLLLADVFENFRTVCIKVYGLDPCQYVTAPSLAWSAALKYTGVELELLTDLDMHHFIKKGIRGGVSQCSVRRAIANNKFLNNYDETKPTSYIAYLDSTNLYGWGMSQPLPTGSFKWLNETDIQNLEIQNLDDNADIGYILEVDLDYPNNLHDLHNELPFCPESLIPPNSNSKIPKLIPNLQPKRNYIIHYRNLKQCLANGLILKRVHRVLTFKQSPWLKKYIDLNSALRNKASNDFEKDFYKLMNNAVFGKTMENVDKRIDVKLLTHWKTEKRKLGAEAYIAKPHFKNCSVFSETLVAVQMAKTQVTYNKPIYVGFSILDVSKTRIYDFYYGHIKKKYGDNALLLYTDTDSLILHIQTDDFYQDMKQDIDHYDTSNYKPDNRHGMPVNRSVLGRMKEEGRGEVINEFIGVGAKAYMIDIGGKLTKKAKGVKGCVTEKDITKSDYMNVVDSMGETVIDDDGNVAVNEGKVMKEMNVFQIKLHEIYSVMMNKVALSFFDEKRYLKPKSYRSLAWGHKDIPT